MGYAREGDHCIGAMVDGKYCPPEHPLQDGDIIELVTNGAQGHVARGYEKLLRLEHAY